MTGKEAQAQYMREWVEKNRDRANENQRKWRAKNKDKIKAYHEKYWEKKAAEMSSI